MECPEIKGIETILPNFILQVSSSSVSMILQKR